MSYSYRELPGRFDGERADVVGGGGMLSVKLRRSFKGGLLDVDIVGSNFCEHIVFLPDLKYQQVSPIEWPGEFEHTRGVELKGLITRDHSFIQNHRTVTLMYDQIDAINTASKLEAAVGI